MTYLHTGCRWHCRQHWGPCCPIPCRVPHWGAYLVALAEQMLSPLPSQTCRYHLCRTRYKNWGDIKKQMNRRFKWGLKTRCLVHSKHDSHRNNFSCNRPSLDSRNEPTVYNFFFSVCKLDWQKLFNWKPLLLQAMLKHNHTDHIFKCTSWSRYLSFSMSNSIVSSSMSILPSWPSLATHLPVAAL